MGKVIFLFFAQWLMYLWCCDELLEIRRYQEDIDYYLKNWPACRTYSHQETLMKNTEISQLMVSMNKLLIRYNRFQNSCAKGHETAATIKTSTEVLQFVEEYDLFEMNIDDYTPEKIFSTQLKYIGVFLAKPSIMSAFSGDRSIYDPFYGEPYYKAITEPTYHYLKRIKEDLEYVAGSLGRLNVDMIEFKEKPNFFKDLWTQFWPLL
ncbi:MAG: hypothetical protein ACK4V2_06960 [Pseudomonadota bacterium]|jgi:hypothetical protein|nr:hypothetical protein [Alphaproteobacteria bacterium]